MFEAMILVCLIVNTSSCKVFEDMRGPYETIGQCNDRAAEMTIEVMNNPELSKFVVSGARCDKISGCLLYTSPSPRDRTGSRMPSSA